MGHGVCLPIDWSFHVHDKSRRKSEALLFSDSCCDSSLVSQVLGWQKIYELVVRHYLACVSQPAIGYGTTATVDIAGEKFTASGLMITAVCVLYFFCMSTTPLVYSINRILYVGLQIASCKNKSDLILQKNYLEVYCYDSWGTSTIPNFEVGQQVSYPVPELGACLLVVNSASSGAVFLHLQH
jgi:hypothetical protein